MIALAVISAAVIAVERWADDSRYVTVEICVEYESALAHADQLGYDSMQSYLSALKELGVVSVGVSQVALADFLLERVYLHFMATSCLTMMHLRRCSIQPCKSA